jgi:hypothetical protein
MWQFWSVVLMAVMKRRLLSHGCGCVASECVLEGRTQRRAPLQAEMTGNDKQIQINNNQEDGLCKQKSVADLKITFTQ